jgi:hypothetical protein
VRQWVSARSEDQVVLRLLRGESLDLLAREAGQPAGRIAGWREEFLSARRSEPMTCVECGRFATEDSRGWRAYRTELPPEAEAEDPTAQDVPPVVFYCPTCAELEFGGR